MKQEETCSYDSDTFIDSDSNLSVELNAELRKHILINSFMNDLPLEIYNPLYDYIISNKTLTTFKKDMLEMYGNTIGTILYNEVQNRRKDCFGNE